MDSFRQLQAYLDGPSVQPPQGAHSNFSHPANLNTTALVVVLVCLIVSTLTLGMRVYTKLVIIRRFGSDDCESDADPFW